jgi:hypothetical protein
MLIGEDVPVADEDSSQGFDTLAQNGRIAEPPSKLEKPIVTAPAADDGGGGQQHENYGLQQDLNGSVVVPARPQRLT